VTVTDLIANPGPETDAQALFEEARRRRRRRRFMVVAALVLALASALGGYLSSRAGNTPRTAATVNRSLKPVVDATAFDHHGNLAFVSRGTLWVLGGSPVHLHSIPTRHLTPSNPTFSPDGRWLAFVASKEKAEGFGFYEVISSQLWLARSNGTEAHPVQGLAFDAEFGWNPRQDLLAVSVGKAETVPFFNPTGIDLVSPTGSIRTLVRGTHIWGADWSPDGSELAVSTEVPSSGFNGTRAVLATYPLSGAQPTRWFDTDTQEANIIVPAGWWRGWGIGYFTVGGGAVPGGSGSADGSPLYAIATPGSTPFLLGKALESEGAGSPSVSSTGSLAFVSNEPNQNVGRILTQGKEIVVCSPTTRVCRAVAHSPDTVTEDPAWSPSGSMLDYVQAPVIESFGFFQPALANWYNAHQLLSFDPSTGSVRDNTATSGATAPQWSTNGKTLLYVSNDGLWLRDSAATAPVQVAQPLFTPGQWPSYYGQVAFSSQFSWSSE